MRIIIFLGLMLSSFISFAFKGFVYEAGSQRKKVLYNIERINKFEENKEYLAIKFAEPDGTPAVTEEAFFVNDKLMRYTVNYHRRNEQGEVLIKDGRIYFEYNKDGKKKKNDEKFVDNFIVGLSMSKFIEANWDKLVAGKTLDVRFGVDYRLDTVGFSIFRQKDKEKEKKARSSRFGEYAEEDAEFLLSRLWITAFEPEDWETQTWPGKIQDSVKLKQKTRILLDSVPYTISRFLWSPDGTRVAIQHQPDPMINSFFHSDIALLDPASGIVTPLIHNPSFDGLIDWSPDGQSILYQTALDDSTSNYYRNGELYITDLTGKKRTRVAANFDEEFSSMNWVENGIYATAYQKTRRMLWRIDPALPDEVQAFITSPDRINDFSITEDGKHLAYIGSSPDQLDEIYVKAAGQPEIQITHNTNQISGWKVADGDVIQWASKDGAQIEGVLMKPADYNPAKKYPLLVVIHGGPTGISLPAPLTSYVYPITQWLAKGALVLMPNYRGSAGYGEGFRSLNVRNLGVGDAWDVLSGVDYLIERGMVDPDSMGCMGWSQGGYISAFLTTNTDRFKAISVGAGISDWMTYYVNTDIHPFTRQYLKSTPWSDPGIYALTSPITTINQAKTPTLIQHGEFDRRVPIANGYELYQGLQDVGVPVKMMVYKGFGHGITKPKERLAATWHNWQWFGKYIWGEELSMPEK